MLKIKIITGSNRPGRFNIQPTTFVESIAKLMPDMEVEVLDLEQIALPFLDEANPPMMRQYTKQHTKDWSAKIDEADGFVFVTPEYNHSYSPILKNAIDFLFQEWNYKPVTFVSYGSLAGGSRAVEHLRSIAAEVKLYDLREQVLIPNYWHGLDEQGEYTFTEDQASTVKNMLTTLVFWAGEMKESRKKLVS